MASGKGVALGGKWMEMLKLPGSWECRVSRLGFGGVASRRRRGLYVKWGSEQPREFGQDLERLGSQPLPS